jgi:putative tricarboxylic transport membrane protein
VPLLRMLTVFADRLSGAFFLLAGLALVFLVIPAFVDDVQDGNIAPATLPVLLSWVIAGGGAWLMVKPSGFRAPPHRQMVRAGLVVGILAGAVGLMSVIGFMLVSPVLALVLMRIGGERRPLWLVVGALVMPALIWLCVAFLLGRVLI